MGNYCSHEADDHKLEVIVDSNINHLQHLKGPEHKVVEAKVKDMITNCKDIKEYENMSQAGELEIPTEMEVVMDQSVRDSLKKWGNFVFRLKNYRGKGNPVKLVKKDNVMYYGEVQPTSNCLEGMGYSLDGSDILNIGYFSDDKLNGPGVAITSQYYFKGIWTDNQMNGFGYNYCDSLTYTGNWLNSLQDGEGQEMWADTSKYTGSFKAGLKHGYGEFDWPSEGSCYKGEFLNNNIHGQGVYTWPDGKKYTGGWVNGKMKGKGKFEWSDGRFFEGQYVDDKKEGFGIFKWPDGRYYEGNWRNGKQDGEGKFVDKTGQAIKGIWKDGNKIKDS